MLLIVEIITYFVPINFQRIYCAATAVFDKHVFAIGLQRLNITILNVNRCHVTVSAVFHTVLG